MSFHKRIYGKHCTTVGELKAALAAIPDDMLLESDSANSIFATVLQDEKDPEIIYLEVNAGDGWNEWEHENREINAAFIKDHPAPASAAVVAESLEALRALALQLSDFADKYPNAVLDDDNGDAELSRLCAWARSLAANPSETPVSYRKLTPDDTLQPGDEYWNAVDGKWVSAERAIGEKAVPRRVIPAFRRPVSPDVPAHPQSGDISDTASGRVIAEILAERERQKSVEGWTEAHDDRWRGGQLGSAAVTYLLSQLTGIAFKPENRLSAMGDAIALYWPWDEEWYKPDFGRRDLVKAGALVTAELERFDRAAKKGAVS